MSEDPILHIYKYGRKTDLHTDACKQGYGAIFLQEAEDGKLHPVYYMSKKTNTAEEKASAFTSKLFNDYCDEENIQHLQIATGVLRGNGQVERIHRTLIPVLTKLSLDDSTKWYKYVDRLQRILNSTICCSTKWTPFELLSENRKTYNRRRKKASLYKEGDLVAIQRTQFGAGLKLRPKFLGPYKVTKVNSKDRERYEVEKVGQHEGPNSTTASADLIKHFNA
ncbi:transposon Tf2-6 polyprotein [Trichonephila clavipes]|nr:transposon Tf2-6 polyprotein [Trichonephila clavipes]